MPDIISHLELLVLNFSRQLLKYHWTTFYVNTIITHWQTKSVAPRREYRCSFFRKIHTALIHRIYLTWTWLYWTFQGVYENLIESYFILVPPLLIINSKRLISGGKKIDHPQEHSYADSSTRSTLTGNRYHISPGPGHI